MTIPEQIALAATFYVEQVFVFCRLTNKNLLEWLLQTICKDHTLRTSANLISRNHLILCSSLFWSRWWIHDPGLPGMKFHPVQPRQISLYDYMWKLNFVLARRDSFPPGICLDLYAISLNFFVTMSVYEIGNPNISIDLIFLIWVISILVHKIRSSRSAKTVFFKVSQNSQKT